MRGALTCPPSSLPLKSFSSTGFHALICHLPLLSCELRLSCFSPWTGRQGPSLRSHLSKRLTSQARAWEPGRTSQGAAAAAANRPLCSDFTAQKVAPDWALPRKAILKAQRVLGIYPAHWPARLPRKPSPDFWASARVWRGTGAPAWGSQGREGCLLGSGTGSWLCRVTCSQSPPLLVGVFLAFQTRWLCTSRAPQSRNRPRARHSGRTKRGGPRGGRTGGGASGPGAGSSSLPPPGWGPAAATIAATSARLCAPRCSRQAGAGGRFSRPRLTDPLSL